MLFDLALIEEPLVVVRVQTKRELMGCYSSIVGHFIIALLLCPFPQVIYPGGFWLSSYKNFPIPLIILAVCESFFDNHMWNHKSLAHFASGCLLSCSTSQKVHVSSKCFQKGAPVCLSVSESLGRLLKESLFCGNLPSWYKKCLFILFSFKVGKTDHSLSNCPVLLTVLLFPVNRRYYCQ